MPRNGTGTFSLVSGNPVVTGTTIESNWANTTLSDIATTLTDSLSRSGQGGMTAALRVADGTQGAPGVGFANETGSGFYRAGTGEVWAVVQGAQTLNLDANGVYVPADKATTVDGAFVFNEAGADKDARFEGDTDANLLFTDASTDRVGIGTATPATKLDVVGDVTVSGAVNAGSVNATTLDLTNVEVTNIKAKDGTSAASIADSTGVVSLVANPVLSGGTANGVTYLNGSKVLTSGSALTFDGTNLGLGGTPNTYSGYTAMTLNSAVNGPILDLNYAGTRQGTFLALTNELRVGSIANIPFTFYQNGSEQMRLTSTGLGIGTSSPGSQNAAARQLVVGNTSANNGITILTGTANDGVLNFNDGDNTSLRGYLIYEHSTDALRFGTSGSEQMRLDSSGNLGIGTSSPAYKLDVLADASTGANNSATGSITRFRNIYTRSRANSAGISGGLYAGQLFHVSGGAEFEIYNADNYPLVFGTNATERMRLDSSGNLGIGTSSPATKLHIDQGASDANGITVAHLNQTSSQVNIGIGYVTAGRPFVGTNTSSNPLEIGTRAATPTIFVTDSAERARIDSSGNLLVGTTSSTNTASTGSRLYSDGAVWSTMSASTDGGGSAWLLYSTGASANRFYVGLGGTVYATNTTISAISDQRFKENIQDLDVGLDKIMALKPRKFDWKAGKGKDIKGDRGFIAQEFEQVFPDLIDEWKDPAPEGEAPYKSVRQDLIPVLVKAMQEQQALITDLRARVAALEA